MIVVDAAEKPIITLTGTENIARNEHNYTRGVKMFQTVTISSQTRKEQEEMGDEVSEINMWAALRKKVPYGLSPLWRGCAHSSFVMTTTQVIKDLLA